jgi:hypothetical protein
MKQLRFMLAIALASGALLTACESSTGGGPGTVTVQLTDKPFPFAEVSEVNVFVVRVDAKTTDPTDADAEDPDNNDGWVTLATPNELVDLLELNGGKLKKLGTKTLANGTYRGFRIIIDPSKSGVVLENGSEPDIIWPSAAQTGIKVNMIEPLVVSSDEQVFIIDFDIGRSFVMRGNDIEQNGLLFKPVVQALVQDITGTITGSVVKDTEDGPVFDEVTVELLKDDTPLDDTDDANVVASTFTDASGDYTFAYVLPGDYEIRFTPPDGSTYEAKLLAGGVTLDEGETITVDTVVLTKP